MLWLGTYENVPENPSEGYCYYNSTEKNSYIYDGSSWQILAQDGTDGTDGTSIFWKGALSTAPENPETYWAYYNTEDQASYIWNGSSWDTLSVSLGGDTVVQVGINWLGTYEEAPANPSLGDAYYNSTLGASYIYDGSVWQQISKDGEDGADGTNGTDGSSSSVTGFLITWKGSLSSAPSNPSAGWAYYNSTAGKSYIYDGSSWQILAQDGKDGTDSSSSSSGSTSSSTSTNYLYVLLYTSKGNYIQYGSQSITTVDFGQIGLNSVSKSTLFHIGIYGTSSTTLNLTGDPAIQISGDNADEFTVTQPSVTSTATGTYIMDASVSFCPTSVGTKTATITIPNDSPDQPDFSFTVTGTGSYWPKTFDSGEGDGEDVVTKILTDSADNVYAVGYGWELANDHSGFDWWIKKFNSTGIEEWEKTFDFYDDDSSTYSPSYDNPKYAVLDSSGNLIAASAYNTVKLDSSGNTVFTLSVGGSLFVDSSDNIFVVTPSNGASKYSSTASLLWSNECISGDIEFDSSDNIVCTSGSSILKIDSDGTMNWNSASTDTTGRYNSIISSYTTEAVAYEVENGNVYLLTWDNEYGTTYETKTMYANVSAKYEGDSSYLYSNQTRGYGTYGKTFTASADGNLVVSVKPVYSSFGYGTYAIALYNSYSSGSDFSSSDWTSGTLEKGGSKTYSLSVTKGRPYIICANDSSYGDGTKTCRVEVSAEYSDGTSILSSNSNTWSSPKIFFATSTDTVTVTVETYSSFYSGTYGIAMKELDYVTPKISGFSTGITNLTAICLDSSDNIYAAGYETNKAETYSKKDIVIKKFSSSGTEISSGWDKTIDYGTCNDETSDDIFFDGSNIVLLGTGYDSISGSSQYDGLYYKYSIDGTLQTSFEIDDWTSSSYDRCGYAGEDTSGNLYFLTYNSGYYLSKYNSSGTLQWKIKHEIYEPKAVVNSSDKIYVAGYGSNLVTNYSSYDWYIKKYASDGSEE